MVEESKDISPSESEHSEKQTQTCSQSFNPQINEEKPMQAYIFNKMKERFEKQDHIDANETFKKGPGRKRKHQLTKTHEVKDFVDKFFLHGLGKLSNNRYNTKRTDA